MKISFYNFLTGSPKACHTLLKGDDNIKIVGCGNRKPVPVPKTKRPNAARRPATDVNGTTPFPDNQVERPNEVVISTGKFFL